MSRYEDIFSFIKDKQKVEIDAKAIVALRDGYYVPIDSDGFVDMNSKTYDYIRSTKMQAVLKERWEMQGEASNNDFMSILKKI